MQVSLSNGFRLWTRTNSSSKSNRFQSRYASSSTFVVYEKHFSFPLSYKTILRYLCTAAMLVISSSIRDVNTFRKPSDVEEMKKSVCRRRLFWRRYTGIDTGFIISYWRV